MSRLSLLNPERQLIMVVRSKLTLNGGIDWRPNSRWLCRSKTTSTTMWSCQLEISRLRLIQVARERCVQRTLVLGQFASIRQCVRYGGNQQPFALYSARRRGSLYRVESQLGCTGQFLRVEFARVGIHREIQPDVSLLTPSLRSDRSRTKIPSALDSLRDDTSERCPPAIRIFDDRFLVIEHP